MQFSEATGKKASRFLLGMYFRLNDTTDHLVKISYSLLNKYRRKHGIRPAGVTLITSGLVSFFGHVLTRLSLYFADASHFVESHTNTTASTNVWKEAYLAGDEIVCIFCGLDAPIHACGDCDTSIDKEICWKNKALCDGCERIEALTVK